jgi:hypothetical protein
LGVSLATAQRWKRTRKLPRMARRAIRALLDGDLGAIDPKWKGWSVRNGMLCGPDTYTFQLGAPPRASVLKAGGLRQLWASPVAMPRCRRFRRFRPCFNFPPVRG